MPARRLAGDDDTDMQLPDLSLLLVLAVFWATYFVLRAFVFKPLGAILDEREKRALSSAASLASVLEREKDTLADVDRRLTEARREAVAEREKLRAAMAAKRQAALEGARDEARRIASEAQAKLEREVAAAREELRTSAEATASEIASMALGRKVA